MIVYVVQYKTLELEDVCKDLDDAIEVISERLDTDIPIKDISEFMDGDLFSQLIVRDINQADEYYIITKMEVST